MDGNIWRAPYFLFFLHKGYGKTVREVAGDESVILFVFIKENKT
jgi:hypothetical protein